jgi:hypothetical protein
VGRPRALREEGVGAGDDLINLHFGQNVSEHL